MENVTRETNQEYLNMAKSFIEASNFYTGTYFALKESMRELQELDSRLNVVNRKSIVPDVHIIIPNKAIKVTFTDNSKQEAAGSNSGIFALTKENNMTGGEAIDAMNLGHKVRLPEWEGYWFKKNGKIRVHLQDGTEIDQTEMIWIDSTIWRNDWQIVKE